MDNMTRHYNELLINSCANFGQTNSERTVARTFDCIKTIADFPTIYRTENLTPLAIMKQSGYSELFSLVTIEGIADYLIQNPKLIEDWVGYSEDIRHSPALAFGQTENGSWAVAYWDDGKLIEKQNFDDKFVACAKMIKMTLEGIRKH